MIHSILTIAAKDFVSELRSKEMLLSMLVFSLMVAVVFNFALPPGSDAITEAAPGILWMIFIFASVLGMNRTFVYEVDKGCLQGLMLAPVERVVIYIGKLLVNFAFIFLVELMVLPLFSIFFKLDFTSQIWPLLFILFVNTLGLAIVGTLFSAISVNTKTREVMLPILQFPVAVPIIMSAVEATSAVLQGQEWSVVWDWSKIGVVFDIVFFVVAFHTFEFVIEE